MCGVCMCVCICVCMHAHLYVWMRVCKYVRTYVRKTCVHTYICMDQWMYVWSCICMCVYECLCGCAHACLFQHICLCMYPSMRTWSVRASLRACMQCVPLAEVLVTVAGFRSMLMTCTHSQTHAFKTVLVCTRRSTQKHIPKSNLHFSGVSENSSTTWYSSAT